MQLGSTPDQPPHTMVRAGLSAFVLLAGLILLAKTVFVAPAADSKTARRRSVVRPSATSGPHAIRALSAYRLANQPRQTHTLADIAVRRQTICRPVSDPPIRIPSNTDGIKDPARVAASKSGHRKKKEEYICGAAQIAHEAKIDLLEPTKSKSRSLRNKLPRRRSTGEPVEQPNKRDTTARRRRRSQPPATPSEKNRVDVSKVEKILKRPSHKGLTPLAKDEVPAKRSSPLNREPLVMESPGWHADLGELTPKMTARKDRIRRCLDFYYDRPLHNLEDSPWSMMHHMIGWGVDSRILIKGSDGKIKNVSTIGWLCGNGICDGERLLLAKDDKIRARTGPGLQGHDGQFLAMLAQTRVSRNQTIRVDGHEFTVDDLIFEEQLSCQPRTELTFKLIGMAHYLPSDAAWTNEKGQKWSISRLIEEELRQPINGTTCGGTHRLMGFTYAVERRRLSGGKIDGPWARAEKVAQKHRNLAFRMQHRDGSFSSDFFRSSGDWGDINRKLKTTGHVLEWLVFSVPPEMLDDPRILRAVDYLTHLLVTNRYYDWENGPLGHGIRALSLYDERVFGVKPGKRDLQMAAKRPRLIPRDSAPSKPPSARPLPRLLRRR